MNTFGRIFRLSSFGESHGPAIGGMVDGCPPQMSLAKDDIQPDLDRRRPGRSRWITQRREKDKIEILSGIFEGKTTGTPIGFIIKNTDARSKDYENIKKTYRPGHADYTYIKKYGIRDYRGGGRASARNTAVWVAGGAIARKYLKEQFGISIVASIIQVANIHAHEYDKDEIDKNPFFCADKKMVTELEEFLTKLRKERDSVGAVIEVQAANVPAGWGSPVFGRLDADIANAMMSINAVKGVEIGKGFASARQHGSHHRDEMTIKDGKEVFLSNNAGGVLGGISTGQDIVSRIAFKPTSSTIKPAKTITEEGENVESIVKGRHDPCVAIRAVPIVEAMMALVLMDALLLHRGQCG